MTKKLTEKEELRNQLDKYFSNKKWFIISLLFFFFLAFIYIRYTPEKYLITAKIKIANDQRDQNALREVNQVNDYGLFSQQSNKVNDEVEVLKSRTIVENIVKDLNLNIQYFMKGKIASNELFRTPPVTINFFSNDSILKNTDTTFTFHVDSKSYFTFDNTTKKLNFGDRIKTTFGDMVIIPHFEVSEMQVGKDVTIRISPVKNVIDFYNSKIKILPAGDESSIINITLEESAPDKGVEILNKLIEEYNNQILENKNNILTTTSDFINNRLQVVSSELSEVDLTAEVIKKDNRLSDLSSQSSIYLESERDIQNQQNNAATQLQLIEFMVNYLDENTSNGDLIPANMSFEDNSINEMTRQHNDLVVQRNRILKNSSEINPVVVNLDQSISSLKQGMRASLNNIMSSYQIKLDALKKEDSKISSKISSAPRKERQFRDLNRQQDIKESLYLYLLQKREESAILHGVSSPNAIIVDKAFAGTSPIWPLKEVVFLGALIFGFLLPLLIIYLNSIIDNKVRTKFDVMRNLSAPFLGDIPQSSLNHPFVKKVDYSSRAEAFRLIRTNIDFLLSGIPKQDGKVIFITSTTSQEGKSNTSINLAKSISFSNKKVLLIETDIRVPKAIKYLKVDKKIGLTDYLVNDKLELSDVTARISENLNIIPSGTIPPNPAELLMNDKLEVLFNAVKKIYDYIIVDTAAVGLVTDTLIISKYADLVVYVVRANYLDKRQLHVVETAYAEKRLPNMAILLNCVKLQKGYGYGYGGDTKKKSKWKSKVMSMAMDVFPKKI